MRYHQPPDPGATGIPPLAVFPSGSRPGGPRDIGTYALSEPGMWGSAEVALPDRQRGPSDLVLYSATCSRLLRRTHDPRLM
jgi:hypothetical protein